MQSLADLLETPRNHLNLEEELTPLVRRCVPPPPDCPPLDRGEFDHKVTLKPGAALPAAPSPYHLSALERRELIRMLQLLLVRNWISRNSSAPLQSTQTEDAHMQQRTTTNHQPPTTNLIL